MWWSRTKATAQGMHRTRALLIPLLFLAACGFTPAYGPSGGADRLTRQVIVAAPEDRAAYLLVRRIEERLGRTDSGRYRLDLALGTKSDTLANDPKGASTRQNRLGRVRYTLRDSATGVSLTRGEVSSFTGYSTTGTTVATSAAARASEERLMVILADEIVDRLVLAAPDLPQ